MRDAQKFADDRPSGRWAARGLAGLLALAAAWAGCAQYDVRVDGFSGNVSDFGKNYVILSAINGTVEGDLEFQEAAGYLQTALAQRGYVHANIPAEADLGILLYFGIGNPQTRFSAFASPMWSQVGGGAEVTTTRGPRGATTTVFEPAESGAAYGPEMETYTDYTKSIIVSAVDLRQYRDQKQLKQFWKTTASLTDLSPDLRPAIPVLIAAAAPYFGSDTGKAVEVNLSDDTPAVQALTSAKK